MLLPLLISLLTLIGSYVFYKYYVPSSPLVPSISNQWSILYKLIKSDFNDLYNLIVIDIGQFTNKNNGISKVRIGPGIFYFISNAEDVSIVSNQCAEKMFLYDFIVPYVGREVVAADGKIYKKNKPVLAMAFKNNVVNEFLNSFNEQAIRLTRTLLKKSDKGEVDVLPDIMRAILESVCQTSLGLNITGEDIVTDQYIEEVHKLLKTLAKRGQRPWLVPEFMFNISNLKKEQDAALKIIWKLSEDMIAQRKKEHLNRLKNNEEFNYAERKYKSIMEIVIENSITENEEKFTNVQLRNIADNMLLAGFDTSSYEILFAMLLLGSVEEIQEKAYREVKEVIGNKETIDKDDLQNLKYVEAVIKEALRLYPVGPVLGRHVDKDIQLSNGVKILEGSSVGLHVWSLNRNPVHWGPDADEFRPERWVTAEPCPEHPSAFATFAPGKRTCIGKAYAMNMMKIVLARILLTFHITADVKKLRLKFDVMLKPCGGHSMTLRRRI